MVKVCNDFDGISRIWCEAFGDSVEDVKYFFDNLKNGCCYAVTVDGKPVSILYLIDCELNGEKVKYVYAACTLNEYKNKGYMSELLSYVCKEYKNVCLVPANEKLLEYYNKRCFRGVYDTEALTFFENDVINNEYLLAGCSLDKPIVLLYKGD